MWKKEKQKRKKNGATVQGASLPPLPHDEKFFHKQLLWLVWNAGANMSLYPDNDGEEALQSAIRTSDDIFSLTLKESYLLNWTVVRYVGEYRQWTLAFVLSPFSLVSRTIFFSPTIRAVALHDNLVRVSSGDHEMGSGREFAGDSPYVNNPCVCGHAPLSSYFVFFFLDPSRKLCLMCQTQPKKGQRRNTAQSLVAIIILFRGTKADWLSPHTKEKRKNTL